MLPRTRFYVYKMSHVPSENLFVFGILSTALAVLAAFADGSSKQSRIIVVCQQIKKRQRPVLIPLTDHVDYFTVTEHHFKLRKRRLTSVGIIIIASI